MLMFSDSLDVIMHLTFSDSLGFLDVGGDISDFMGSLDRGLDRAGLVRVVMIDFTDNVDDFLS